MKNDNTTKMPISSTVSAVLSDGRLVELVQRDDGTTAFAVGAGDGIEIVEKLEDRGTLLVPVPAANNLIAHGAVLLPGEPLPYSNDAALADDIAAFIDRYLDLSPEFRSVATAYVLLSWIFERFEAIPYLRFRGDYGSGKSRALSVIGALCHKGFFASGASTVSPIFYTLDTFRGTLLLDEADFRTSDEKADIVKILNNGHTSAFPVLRQTMNKHREFDPRAFRVFGPKIIAMRHSFEDIALESRFLTEDTGLREVRSDIPLRLPPEFRSEAAMLRRLLLSYRFRTFHTIQAVSAGNVDVRSNRARQLLSAILAVATTDTMREDLISCAKRMEGELRIDRAVSHHGMLLDVLRDLVTRNTLKVLTVSEITSALIAKYGREFDRPVTPRFVGELLRKRLYLRTYRSHGTYVLPLDQKNTILTLASRLPLDEAA